MNIEASRLATFASWPSNFPVDVRRLARGGFFSTCRDLEAQCYWCRQLISDWRYGDQVRVFSLSLSPEYLLFTDGFIDRVYLRKRL